MLFYIQYLEEILVSNSVIDDEVYYLIGRQVIILSFWVTDSSPISYP